ncbi:HAD family phosphatase [Yoonia sp.]|uniref:HAD family hydrolase n=1 Tax=Yoonia sp. TaxID=2212373 RepID=UPI0023924B48|nr:HAD family phosphatase [Yoonia sp.]MDE0850495.1 HAD family phosphatase [Yoonia sp.]
MRHSIFHHAETTRELTSDAWPQLITDGGYEAVIFDCDGTLVESGEAHFKAFQTAVRTQGYEMDRTWYNARTGLDRKSILAELAKTVDGPFDVGSAVSGSITAFIAGSAAVLPIPETTDLARILRQTHKLAVVTNSEKQVAAASLCSVGLQTLFDYVVTISDGAPPKPAPDLFIAAAKRLNTSVTKTLVLEDSKEGVQAATQAGMDVLQIMPATE